MTPRRRVDLPLTSLSLPPFVHRRCPSCGSGEVEWLTPGDAAAAGIPLDQARAFLGVIDVVWRCAVCGDWGALGPTETS